MTEFLSIIFLAVLYIAYLVIAGFIVFHLFKFGIGPEPKILAIIFIVGIAALSIFLVIALLRIDTSSLLAYGPLL